MQTTKPQSFENNLFSVGLTFLETVLTRTTMKQQNMVCECIFKLNQTSLKVGDHARFFPSPLSHHCSAQPLWNWMDEETQTSTGPIVPQHQKELWHGRGFDREASTGEGSGLVLGARRSWHPNWWAHKETPTRSCRDFCQKCKHIVHTQSFILSCMHRLMRNTCCFFDDHLCLYLRQSRTIIQCSGCSAAV